MRFVLKEHKDFFYKEGFIGFEEFLTPEDCDIINNEIKELLSNYPKSFIEKLGMDEIVKSLPSINKIFRKRGVGLFLGSLAQKKHTSLISNCYYENFSHDHLDSKIKKCDFEFDCFVLIQLEKDEYDAGYSVIVSKMPLEDIKNYTKSALVLFIIFEKFMGKSLIG